MSDRRDEAANPDATTSATNRATPAGFVPVRANRRRDGVAVALLLVAALLPWNLRFGVGVPGSSGLGFLIAGVVTLLAIGAAVLPHVGPHRLSAPHADVARKIPARLWLCAPYLVCVVIFVGLHLVQTIRFGGTGAVPPGIGPGLWVGVGGALLAAQPPITSTTLVDNGFHRWYRSTRLIGVASIVLAAWAVVFNLFWRLRYLFVTDVTIGSRDVAVIVATLLYGAVAMTALVIGSRWLTQQTAADRLATTALGVSTALAGTLVWVTGIGRDVDAFHGIAENTSTNAVGYEGYLAWAAAAAIVAPTTLYAVFLIRPPTLAAFRGAALKCLTLIAFWTSATAVLRIVDFVIAQSLDLPRSSFNTVTVTAFNLVTAAVAAIAIRLNQRLSASAGASIVIAAFTAVLVLFTAARLVIGVALAPRYTTPTPRSPDAVYGNDLAQQFTSTFDVVICALSVAVLLAALVTTARPGRRRPRRTAAASTKSPVPAEPPVPTAPVVQAPPLFAPATVAQPAPRGVPRIVRINRPSPATTQFPTSEIPAATTNLRIHRRPDPTSGPPTDG